MAELIPLSLYRYNPERHDARPEWTAAPPYDEMTMDDRELLAAKSPWNVVHVELPQSCREGAETLDAWLKQGVLVREEPAAYLLASGPEDEVRLGLLCGVPLAPFGSDGMYALERTFLRPANDRLEHMRSVGGQFAPVTALYEDPDAVLGSIHARLAETPPLLDFDQGDGVTHRIWRLSDADTERLRETLAGRDLFVAEGHHRYLTALDYMAEREAAEPGTEGSWRQAFVCLVDANQHGLRIEPCHRLLTWYRRFDWEGALEAAEEHFLLRLVSSPEELERAENPSTCLLALQSGLWLMTARSTAGGPDAGLAGVQLVDRDFFGEVLGLTSEHLSDRNFLEYTTDAMQALSLVEEGAAQAACILGPLGFDLLRDTALAGQPMPRRSVTLPPRVPTGLIFQLFR